MAIEFSMGVILSFNLWSELKNAVMSPVTVSSPVMAVSSLISVVPLLESRVRLPDVVVIVFSSILMLSTSSLPSRSNSPLKL